MKPLALYEFLWVLAPGMCKMRQSRLASPLMFASVPRRGFGQPLAWHYSPAVDTVTWRSLSSHSCPRLEFRLCHPGHLTESPAQTSVSLKAQSSGVSSYPAAHEPHHDGGTLGDVETQRRHSTPLDLRGKWSGKISWRRQTLS